MPHSPKPADLLLLSVAPFLWSSLTVVGRAVIGTVPPFSLTFWSMIAALLVLIPVGGMGLFRQRRQVVRELPRLVIYAALGIAAFKSLYYLGIALTTAVNASILGPTLPIMISCFAWIILGERMNRPQLMGVFITLLGVAVISVQGQLKLFLSLHFNPGDVLILLSFTAMAIYTVMLRKVATTLSPWAFVTIIFTFATIMIAPFYLQEHSWFAQQPTIPWQHALPILYIGIGTYIFGILFWNLAVARLGATLPALSVFLIPVFGIVLARIFLKEYLHWYHVAGLALIMPGVFLAIWNAQPPPEPDSDTEGKALSSVRQAHR